MPASFLDFSKAFDKVDHRKLVKKLIKIRVNSQITNWTQDFLAQRTQIVVIDGYRSTAKPVTSGVPQGSVVGLVLFLVYINDMLADINSEVRLFADDTVIYNLAENNTKLRDDLSKLEIWETAWSMEFNPTKCEHLKFTRKRQNTTTNSYTLHNTVMFKVPTVKYHGVKLQSSLRWMKIPTSLLEKLPADLGISVAQFHQFFPTSEKRPTSS